MRDRLIELLNEKQKYGTIPIYSQMDDRVCRTIEVKNTDLADHLLANGVIVPTYKPFPVVLSEDENNSDVFCPFCDTDLSGHYYGGDYEPPKIVTCFGCGTWLDGTKAITKEETVQALKGNVPDTNVGKKGGIENG